MSGNFFLDSNVCLYLLDKALEKKEVALALLNNSPIISTQVLNENINVLFKKYTHFSSIDIAKHVRFLVQNCTIEIITENTIKSALTIKERY